MTLSFPAPRDARDRAALSLDSPELFFNRDLSLIEFYRRVFDEARDDTNPLLERVKFLAIVGTIIDEFAVTRYGELAEEADAGAPRRGEAAGSPAAHLKAIESALKDLMAEARQHLRQSLVPALAAQGIHLVDYSDLRPKERGEVEAYFTETVLPLLMPLGVDAARPFPHVTGLNLAVIVRQESGTTEQRGKETFACVPIPATISGLVPFHWRGREPAGPGRPAELQRGLVWLNEVIAENLSAVFPGMTIVDVFPFRVFRDADIDPDLSNGATLPSAIEQGVREREFGEVLALVVSDRMLPAIVELLSRNLAIASSGVHRVSDLTGLAELMNLARLDQARPDLQYPPLAPRASVGGDILASIRAGDILLHHPFESFEPVIEFFERAAQDPDVLAISTTLYRVGHNSPIVDSLLKARHAGKQVRVLIELRARFDERNNLTWGRALADAGAHVVYGMVKRKVHAKLTLIVRREAGKIRRYVHLSSGNYNVVTSRIYTDLSVFTCHDDIASDATDVFNFLTGYAAPSGFRKLLVAPTNLRSQVARLIDREIDWVRRGQAGHMILKMNALVDKEIIRCFYRASQAGVRVDLIVRGICCLRPGIAGVSENIRVVSIVGRFLEHSRAWYFRNGGHEEVYVGSADLMPRNLDQRVEVMTPVEDARLKRRIHTEILAVYLADNVKARELMPDGRYARVGRRVNDAAIHSQEDLL